MSLLKVDHLCLRFGGLTAVNDLCLEVKPGEIYAIIGPNGAGKTSAFNVITGVYAPTGGEVLVHGKALRRPYTLRVLAGLIAAGVFTAVGLVLLVNLEALWSAAITGNYVFEQPFPWGQAFRSGWEYLIETERKYTLVPAAVGGMVGMLGTLIAWRRARRKPEVVARACVARTFQNLRLFHQLTVLENVLIGMDTKLRTRAWHAALRLPRHRREAREAGRKALEILKFVGLEKEANQLASSLPYGHQRRLEVARALALEPELLLLDEPGAGMNPSEAGALIALIKKIREQGVTVLLIEHHMKVVMGVSDRICVLQYGNKIAEGTPTEIQANPAVRAAYLGAEA